MHFVPPSITNVQDMGRPEINERPGEPDIHDRRPLLSFLRRPQAQQGNQFWCELVPSRKPESQIPTTNPITATELLDNWIASVNAGTERTRNRTVVANACRPEELFCAVLVECCRHQNTQLGPGQLSKPGGGQLVRALSKILSDLTPMADTCGDYTRIGIKINRVQYGWARRAVG